HRHPENPELCEACNILPGERAVHVLQAARLELALRELAHGGNDAPLLLAQLEPERGFGAHAALFSVSSPRTRGPITTDSGIWVPACAGTTTPRLDLPQFGLRITAGKP